MNNKILIISTVIITLFIISYNLAYKNNKLMENFAGNNFTCVSGTSSNTDCKLPMTSENGKFILNVTNEGFLYIEEDGVKVWQGKEMNRSDTGINNGPYTLKMQSDGNLVLYNKSNKPVFSANNVINENAPFRLIMQNDRNLVIYNKNNTALWNTKTQFKNYKNESWDSLNPPRDNNTLFLSFIADDKLEVYHDPGSKYPIGYRNVVRKGLKDSEDSPKLVGKATCCNTVYNMAIPNFQNGDRVLLYLLNTGGPGYFAGHAVWNGVFYPTNAVNYKIVSVETKLQNKGVNGYVTAGKNYGCYKDQVLRGNAYDARRLPVLLSGKNMVSQEECRDLALSDNKKYYGLQYGGECWAGNDFQLATSNGKATCSMRGKKNDVTQWTQILGDAFANELYDTFNPPEVREISKAGHASLHSDARMINAKEGPDDSKSLNYWVEFEFKPTKPKKERSLNDIGIKSMCDPALENTQGKVKNPFCNYNLTDEELNKVTFLSVNTSNDFVKKTFNMGDATTNNTYLYGINQEDKTTTFSYSFWIKINELKDYWRGIFRQGTPSDQNRMPGFYLYPGQTAMHFRVSTVDNWNDGLDIETGEIALNKWYHITYTVNSNVIKCYINGKFYKRNRLRSKVLGFNKDNSKLYINNYDNATDKSVDIAKLRVYPMEIEKDFIQLILLTEVPTDNKKYYECMEKNNKLSRSEAHLACYDLIFNDTITVKDNGKLLELKEKSLYDTSPLNGHTRPPSFKVLNGICFLSGILYNPSYGPNCYLSREARPEKRLVFFGGNTKEVRVDIFPNGRISVFGASDGYVSLDNIHFPVSFKGKSIEYLKPKKARYVRVSLSTGEPLSVAEIEVYPVETPSENIARNKRVITSSVAAEGYPDRATDGKTDGKYNSKTVTHTNESRGKTEFLEIDLNGNFNVKTVKIFNRTDCCMARIFNARISLLDDNYNEIDFKIWDTQPVASVDRTFQFSTSNEIGIDSGWSDYHQDYRNGGYTIVKDVVYLSGLVRIKSGKVKLNSIIGRVGRDAIPSEYRVCTSIVDDTNSCRVDIDTQGYIILRDFNQNKNNWDWVSLDSISYCIKKYPNLPLASNSNQYKITLPPPIVKVDNYNSYTQQPITVPNKNLLGDMTISFWVNCSKNWRQNPFWKGYAGEGAITIEENGSISYYYGQVGNNGYPYEGFNTGKTVIQFDKWNHVAITRDLPNKQINMYINGSKVQSNSSNYTMVGKTNADMTIGKGYVNNLLGYLKDLNIYDTALSSNSINWLYNAGTASVLENYPVPFITKIEETVYLGGTIPIPNVQGRVTIARLDEQYRPNKLLVFNGNQNSNIGKMNLASDGYLTLEFFEPSAGFLSLDGICYNTNKY